MYKSAERAKNKLFSNKQKNSEIPLPSSSSLSLQAEIKQSFRLSAMRCVPTSSESWAWEWMENAQIATDWVKLKCTTQVLKYFNICHS